MRRLPGRKRRLKPLERLLIDADVRADLVPYLNAVGFDAVFATQVNVDIHDDVAILKSARRQKRILVCHDQFRGRTRFLMYTEIYRNGGRIIRIGGEPGQHALASLGRILIHRQRWVEWFQENDGIVIVNQGEMRTVPRRKILETIGGMSIDPPPVPKVVKAKRRGPTGPRKRSQPIEQGELLPDQP